jgi:hypothetical protein
MAVTTINSQLSVEQWENDYSVEYVRDSSFGQLTGTSHNSPIRLVEVLKTKPGKTAHIQMVGRLSGTGITGDNTMEGQEEELDTYEYPLTIDQVRNACVSAYMEQKGTNINIPDASREMLKLWAMDDLRDTIIEAAYSPVVDGVTAYDSATEAQKDTWVAAQRQSASNVRVLFGQSESNYSASDHSASLANIDGTNDILKRDSIRLAKRFTKATSPHIRPVRVKMEKGGAKEVFILCSGSLPVRDLEDNIDTIRQNADVRGAQNGIFSEADIVLSNVAVMEIPEIPVKADVGNGGTVDISANFFMGAEALVIAWGRYTKIKTKSFDYDNQDGVSVSDVRGVGKPHFLDSDTQHGMLTMYTSAEPDA